MCCYFGGDGTQENQNFTRPMYSALFITGLTDLCRNLFTAKQVLPQPHTSPGAAYHGIYTEVRSEEQVWTNVE
uniref:Copine domain-containing protein n=1 Tax=Ascaris lumbricoides TaxID=6252 RepID=A0A0M3HPS5_ASCLU